MVNQHLEVDQKYYLRQKKKGYIIENYLVLKILGQFKTLVDLLGYSTNRESIFKPAI